VSRSKLPLTRLGLAGLLSAAALCCAPAPAGATTTTTTTPPANRATPGPNLLHNGKFADPASAKNYQAPPPGWAVGGSYARVYCAQYGYQAPPGGTCMLELGLGSVTQTVKTTAGWTYLLQWYESGAPNGYGPPVKVVHVVWDSAVVAARSVNAKNFTSADMHWVLRREVVTATSDLSTLEFANGTVPASGSDAMVGSASLAGDAKLYLPTTITLSPTGKLVAIVRTATGAPLADPALSVKLYGTWKETSYAPPSTQLIASGTVLNGQAVLQLDLHAAMASHTIPAYATLAGPGFIPVTEDLAIKVS
jgi:hypothetical protein